jgi:hypothetical protein
MQMLPYENPKDNPYNVACGRHVLARVLGLEMVQCTWEDASMPRLAVALLVVTALTPPPVASPTHRAAPARTQTVFGQGPELHLLPSYGPVGTTVLVVGLGYRPGSRVAIKYGPPNAEFMPTPVARVTVSAQGTFRTTFRATCQFITLRRQAPSRCTSAVAHPLIFVGLANTGTPQRTQTTAFIVTVV